jgi:uncharacterized protein with HEPN domain
LPDGSSIRRGLEFVAYERDSLVQDAVERRIAVIGEALNQAANRHPAIVQVVPELRQIVGARNRLIHDFDAIDAPQFVWGIVQDKPPLLEASIEALIDRESASDSCADSVRATSSGAYPGHGNRQTF